MQKDEWVCGYLGRLITNKISKSFGRYKIIDDDIIKLYRSYEYTLRRRAIRLAAVPKSEATRLSKMTKEEQRRYKQRRNPERYKRQLEHVRRLNERRWKDHIRQTPIREKLTSKQRSDLRRQIMLDYWQKYKCSKLAADIVDQLIDDILDSVKKGKT